MAKLNGTPEERAAHVARSSYGRLLAILAASTGDIAAAEDALADAFERAIARWPHEGLPMNPEAWLLTVARNRQRDRLRSAAFRNSLPLEEGAATLGTLDTIDPDAIPDQRLAMLFVCAHPAIDPAIRTPLMLQAVLGFRADQIATAFALPGPAMAQRLVRAKRRIRDAGIPFTVPGRHDMPSRLPEVLEAIYGAYAIEWSGALEASVPAPFSTEALYLAETLAELLPAEPEVLGLAALVCLSLARLPARVDSHKVLVPPQSQDTTRWDESLIQRGEHYLSTAHALGRIGRFQLEAAIQSVHCNRRRTGITDWNALRTLYAGLLTFSPTLGARVAYAVVLGETEDARAGLQALEAIDDDRVDQFQPAWAAIADLRARLGDTAAARHAYHRAISLTSDSAAVAFLERQVALLDDRPADDKEKPGS